MAQAAYSAHVTFTYTLTLSETEAEVLRDILHEDIHDERLLDDEGLSLKIAHAIHDTLQENIEGAHRMGLVPRKPEHRAQPTEIVYPMKED